MVSVLLVLVGVIAAFGICLFLPPAIGRGGVLTLAAALLLGAHSPAAANAGSWPSIVLPVCIGLLLGGACTRAGDGVGRLSQDKLAAVVLGYFLLTVAVTVVLLPAGASQQAQYAIVAIGAFLTSRGCTAAERLCARKGIVLIAVAQAAAAVYEMAVAQTTIFWPNDASSYVLNNPFLNDSVVRTAGSTGHPIALGTLIALAVVLVMTMPKSSVSPAVRVVVLAVLGGGLLASGTRSAVIATAAAVFYVVATSEAGRRGWRLVVLVVAGGIGLVASSATLGQLTQSLLDSGSFENRAGSIASAPALVLDRPFFEALLGTGWGSENELFARGFFSQNGFGIVDNQFVTTLATFGLVGLVAVVALFATAWRDGDRAVRASVIVLVCMAFAFDYLRWAGVVVVLFALLPRSTGVRHPGPAPLPHAPTTTEPNGVLL